MKAVKNFISKSGIFGELLSFLWQRKLWWLIPMVVLLVLFGVFMILSATSGVAPFIYTIF
jgi:hypothetical protein